MTKRAQLAVVAALCVGSAASRSSAQERQERPEPSSPAPPRDAIEIGLGLGATGGTGTVSDGEALSDTARAGGALEIGLGYRFDPSFLFGVYASYGRFAAAPGVPDGAHVRTVTAGLEGQWHFLPYSRLDPWIGVGAGYRGISIVPDGRASTGLREGVQVARLRLGVDWRVSRAVALGPVLGVDATVFVARRDVGEDELLSIDEDDLALSTFVFGGLGGRFDLVR